MTHKTPVEDPAPHSRLRSYWLKFHNFVVYEILHANDSPHRLSLGVAVGFFVAFTPTIPFQMMLTLLISVLIGANKVVGLPVVWLTNPATLIPVYLPQYLLGCKLLGRSPKDVDWGVLVRNHGGFWAYAEAAWGFMLQIFAPLWVGSLLVAGVLAVASYYVTKIMIVRYRLQRYGTVVVPVKEIAS